MATFDDFVEFLQGGKLSYQDLKELGFPRSTAERYLKKIRDEGMGLYEETENQYGRKRYYLASANPEPHVHIQTPQAQYRLGITSDWHIGAKSCYEDSILQYIQDCKEAEIDMMLHAGDLFDGWNIYKGQIHELKPEAIGIDKQVEYVNQFLPEFTFPFKIIAGNHDVRNDANMLRLLAGIRPDIEYLGDFDEIVDFNGVKIEMIHPSGGKPYSRGYKIQKLLRERQDGTLPDLFLMGHLHSALFMPHKGMIAMETGAFAGPNILSRRNGWDVTAQAWIVDLWVDDGKITQILPHYLKYEQDLVCDPEK